MARDLSHISDEDLLKMQMQVAQKPVRDLSHISDEELLSMDKANQPKSEIAPTIIDKAYQGAVGGFGDEIDGFIELLGRAGGVEGLGGKIKNIRLSDNGPTINLDEIKKSYIEGRDKSREAFKKEDKDHPIISQVSEIAGSFVSPINKLSKGMGAIRSGATQGAISAVGNSEANNVADMVTDAGYGATIGGSIGKATDIVTPYVGKAAKYVGEKAKGIANRSAFASLGPVLKDFRNLDQKEIGQYALDNKLVEAGDTFEKIAEKVKNHLTDAGGKLDTVYKSAGQLFKDSMTRDGFDPIRDKAGIMGAAKKELGNTVGADAALERLGRYLDEIAAKNGDTPNEAAKSEYKKAVDNYLPKLRQFLKDRKEYRNELGQAGEDLDQPLLSGMQDDMQRTGTIQRSVELQGKDANVMRPSQSELDTQMGLFPLPQRPQAGFNPARGDDLLPTQQQMFLDDVNTNKYLTHGEQGSIDGTDLVPRTYVNADGKTVTSGQGQMKFSIPPTAPNRPIKPDDVRNAMSPRQTNDVKSSIDEAINYARNPLAKEPAFEKALSAARNKINDINLKAIDALGADGTALKAANKQYGTSSKIYRIVDDRLKREDSWKTLGLTDAITGGAALTYGATTGDYKGAAGIFLAKKGLEKYGPSTIAAITNKVGKKLLENSEIKNLADKNPRAFAAAVYGSVNNFLDSKRKGEDKWMSNGIKNIEDYVSESKIEKLKQTKKGRDLLIRASDLKPESKAMKSLLLEIGE